MKKVAIFDIDGTIFRSSLLIEVTEALIKEKVFLEDVRNSYKKDYQNWITRKGSYEKYIMSVVRAFEENIKGVKHEDFSRIVKKVIALHGQKVYCYTRDLVKDLKKKKYFLLAISHSPKELVDGFCRKLGFDKVYGRMYEYDAQKKFTGKTLHLDVINNKANILRRFIEKENLSLADSYGVGDSESDINFLTFADNPICFNPNSKLYAHAKKAGWPVVVERKDVVYKMSE